MIAGFIVASGVFVVVSFLLRAMIFTAILSSIAKILFIFKMYNFKVPLTAIYAVEGAATLINIVSNLLFSAGTWGRTGLTLLFQGLFICIVLLDDYFYVTIEESELDTDD